MPNQTTTNSSQQLHQKRSLSAEDIEPQEVVAPAPVVAAQSTLPEEARLRAEQIASVFGDFLVWGCRVVSVLGGLFGLLAGWVGLYLGFCELFGNNWLRYVDDFK